MSVTAAPVHTGAQVSLFDPATHARLLTLAEEIAARLPAFEAQPDRNSVIALGWEGHVSLQQVLTYARPAYGGDTWAEALPALLAYPSDARVVEHLLDELRTGAGHFLEPVSVGFTDPGDWDEDTVPCPTGPHVANGMHRITAATLAGLDTITLTQQRTPRPEEEYVEVVFTLTGTDDLTDDDLVRLGMEVDDDARPYRDLEFIATWMRSFRLTEHVWVENVASSCSNGTLEGVWSCPRDLAEALLAQLVARSDAAGLVFTPTGHRTYTDAELAAELAAEGY